MQSRKSSIIEATVNLVVGYTMSVLIARFIIGSLLGLPITTQDSFIMTTIYTFVSFARVYILRRVFTKRERKKAVKASIILSSLERNREILKELNNK